VALIKCHECDGPLSTSASFCPKCGAKPNNQQATDSKPVKKNKLSAIHWLGIIIFGSMFSVLIFGKPPAQNTSTLSVSDADCRQSITCWSSKYDAPALIACKARIEDESKHSYRWTDGTLELKFSKIAWLNKNNGTFYEIGDKIEFQNGFGAYTPMTYRCGYDPQKNSVIDLQMNEGRLPR
jgi:hypothetical protein